LLTNENILLWKIATEELSPFGVEVLTHDRSWIESQKMGSFLSVTRGSYEEPVFLEMIYKPSVSENLKPVALVGKNQNCILVARNFISKAVHL